MVSDSVDQVGCGMAKTTLDVPEAYQPYFGMTERYLFVTTAVCYYNPGIPDDEYEEFPVDAVRDDFDIEPLMSAAGVQPQGNVPKNIS